MNNLGRLLKCWRAGAVSIDGTGWFHKAGHQGNDLRKFLRETAAVQVAAGDAEIEGRNSDALEIRLQADL